MKIWSFILALIFAGSARADTHVAASTDRADVSAAITAAVDGDIVRIPEGSSTWNSGIQFAKDIKIVGAGVGKTIITRGEFNDELLHWTVGAGGFELSGIEFSGNNFEASKPLVQVDAGAAGLDNKIHNCSFRDYTNRALRIKHAGFQWWGVIYECTFSNAGGPQDINIQGGENGYDSESWEIFDSALGTRKFWFVEDCIFRRTGLDSSDTSLDAFAGAKYVFRYNTCVGVNTSHHGTTHPHISPLCWEIYGNDYQDGLMASINRGFMARGGTGVHYNNRFGSSYKKLHLSSYRTLDPALTNVGNWGWLDGNNSDNLIFPDGNETPADGTGDGTHIGGTSATVLTSAINHFWLADQWANDALGYAWYVRNITDGSGGFITANTANTATATLTGGVNNEWREGDVYEITDGYPGIGQIGMGSKTGKSYAEAAIKQPVVAWGNLKVGAPISLTTDPEKDSSRHIKEGRDFINGTSLADVVDADPTKPGNQAYVPFTYPHPLRGRGSGSLIINGTLRVGP